ncbi:hypothetical protein YTPLAS73_09770 [Nitrosarchaeum sp.]|nr:hypothetical protein YTPLAS73_09770 [Nitrosarchaeum sp.]
MKKAKQMFMMSILSFTIILSMASLFGDNLLDIHINSVYADDDSSDKQEDKDDKTIRLEVIFTDKNTVIEYGVDGKWARYEMSSYDLDVIVPKMQELTGFSEEQIRANITVIDNRSDNDDSSDKQEGKIKICHIAPGNSKENTITINKSSLNEHISHGDYEGECKNSRDLTDKKDFQSVKDSIIERLEKRIDHLEERVLSLLGKIETGQYYGNISNQDVTTNSYDLSFAGVASSIVDVGNTENLSGKIILENIKTGPKVSKFKVVDGEITIGDATYDLMFGKARTSGASESMILIGEVIDSEGNIETLRFTLKFDKSLSDIESEPSGITTLPNSKISHQWNLDATGEFAIIHG